jgi:hypothetical protein
LKVIMLPYAHSNCYWVHPQILVGGQIIDASDWSALAALGPEASINLANDVGSDVGKGIPRLIECGQPDDGTPRDPKMVRDYVAFASEVLKAGGSVYVHCAAGCCRGASGAYAILRGALGFPPAAAIVALLMGQPETRRCGGHPFGEISQTAAYVASIEAALAGSGG